MPLETIRVLLVDDDEDFLVLIARYLADSSSGEILLSTARDYASALREVGNGPHDVLLIDYYLGEHTGLDFLREIRARGYDLPALLLTGRSDSELDRKALEAGTSDYLEKYDLSSRTLERAIRYALGRHRDLQALRKSERMYRSLMEQSTDAVFVADLDMNILEVNENACRLQGYSREEALRVNIVRDLCDPADLAARPLRMQEMLSGQVVTSERPLRRRDGSLFTAEISIRLIDNSRFQGIIRDITARKTAEEKLKESEQYYRLLLENSRDVALVIGPDRTITYEAPSTRRVLGRQPGEMVGQNAFVNMHPEDVERLKGEFQRVLQNPGETVTLELRMRHSDGSWRWVEGNAQNLVASPLIRGIVINYRDITERRDAEEALRRSERQFRSLIENAFDVIGMIDAGGKLTYESPSVERIMGRKPADQIGRDSFDFIHSDDLPKVRDAFARISKSSGLDETLFIRIRHEDGSWRDVELLARNRLQDPDVKAIIFNYRDITERLNAEKVLQNSERYFRALIENALDVIVVFDAEGRIVYETPSIQNVLGLKPEERLGRNVFSLLHPEDLSRAQSLFETLRKEPGRAVSSHFRLRHRDGSWRMIEGIGTNLLANPAVRGIILNYRDVTDARNAQDRLIKYERLAALGEITAGLAHEIRNPLATILPTAQYLKTKAADPKGAADLDPILEQSERIRQLINETLDYSKNPALHSEVIPVRALLERVLMLARTQFGPDHARTRVLLEVPEGLPALKADRRRLEQALVNLLMNAFQALAPKGGTITLSCGIIDGEIQLIVRDDGPGIREEDLPKIFEPFFSTRRSGSGLGLSICQRMAAEHGGRVTVERPKTGGVAFAIVLPIDGGKTA